MSLVVGCARGSDPGSIEDGSGAVDTHDSNAGGDAIALDPTIDVASPSSGIAPSVDLSGAFGSPGATAPVGEPTGPSFNFGCAEATAVTELAASSNDDASRGYSIATRSDGGYVVGGTFHGAIWLGDDLVESHGKNDIFVVAFDASGKLLWSRTFGGVQDDQLYRIRVDRDDNVLFAGRGTGGFTTAGQATAIDGPQGFVAKLQSHGKTDWVRMLGATESKLSLATGPNGEIAVAGVASAPIDFGGGETGGAYVLELDREGAYQWERHSTATDIAFDQSGDLFVADRGLAKLDSEGRLLWEKSFGAGCLETMVRVAPSGDVVVAAKLIGWADFGGGKMESTGLRDVIVGKLSTNGAYRWGKQFGSGGNHWPTGLAIDPKGNVLLTGGTEGSIDFGGGAIYGLAAQLFFAELDPNGAHLCSRSLDTGATETMSADTLAVGAQGHAVMTGTLIGTMDVDTTTAVTSQAPSAFVLRL